MYLAELREEVSQGDIFQDLVYQYITQDAQDPEPRILSRVLRAMLLTYDCEYDKRDAAFVYVGELRPLEEISASTRGHVRSRRVLNTFSLETHERLPEEFYVDFRRILRLTKSAVAQSSLSGNRVVSLSDTSRLALQQQMSLFFGFERDRPAD